MYSHIDPFCYMGDFNGLVVNAGLLVGKGKTVTSLGVDMKLEGDFCF